jgi:hypothetical protein
MISIQSRAKLPNQFRQSISVLLALVFFIAPLCAQQPITTPAAPLAQKSAPPKAPAASLETLLSYDAYKVYGEVRDVGEMLSTSDELLDPVMKLSDPPKEIKELSKFLKANAALLTASRMIFAMWPARAGIPDFVAAIEMSSTEDAAKLEPKINRLLPLIMPTPIPILTPTPLPLENPNQTSTEKDTAVKKPEVATSSSEGPASLAAQNNKPTQAQLQTKPAIETSSEPPAPPFVVSRSGKLIFVSDKPFKLEKLHPAGSKLLIEDQNFLTARNRFPTESQFIYVNVALKDQTKPPPPTKEEIAANQARMEKEIEEANKEAQNSEAMPDAMASPSPEATPQNLNPEVNVQTTEDKGVLGVVTVPAATPTPTKPELAQAAAFSQMGSIFALLADGEPEWPDGVGIAISQEPDAYVVRAILVGPENAKRLVIPFAPQLFAGRAYLPNAPSVLPDDTEVFVSGSFDSQKTYDAMVARLEKVQSDQEAEIRKISAERQMAGSFLTTAKTMSDPFTEFEKKGGFKIREDLLPALGNEIALGASMKGLSSFGFGSMMAPFPTAAPEAGKEDQVKAEKEREAQSAPVMLISVRDREAARKLMPMVLNGLGIGEANLIAQTERRDDTEMVNFAGAFAYAFVGDFVVISTTPTVKHVIDCYLNHQTLSSNGSFRNFTHWQPREMIGQIYISPVMMESYQKAIHDPKQTMAASMREFLTRLNPMPQAVTYALSSESAGTVHELHVPKALVIASIAGAASFSKEPPPEMNEQIAISGLHIIASAEESYKATAGKGSYGTLDQLFAQKLLGRKMLEEYGYKFDVATSSDHFEATATPVEYGKGGRRSFFVDQTGVVRGDDHGGAPANAADKPAQQ